MNTTSLFIDLLISGMQVALWLCLLIASVIGVDPKFVKEIKGWEVVLAVVLLPVVYPVGIFIDNLADDLLRPLGRRIRSRFKLDDSPSVMKLLTRTKDDSLSRYFEYVRTRIRISRSSALNFALITLFGEVFVLSRWEPAFGSSRWLLAVLVGSLGGILTTLAFYSWYRITLTFSKKLAYGLALSSGEQKEQEEKVKEVVADIVA
jgi:hypothetical protein